VSKNTLVLDSVTEQCTLAAESEKNFQPIPFKGIICRVGEGGHKAQSMFLPSGLKSRIKSATIGKQSLAVRECLCCAK